MRLLVCAAEASGEALALGLLAHLGPVSAVGLAGARLQAAGVQPIALPEGLGSVGLVESLAALPRARRAQRRLLAALDTVDAVLTVDSPSLLLRVGEAAVARGLPVVHVASPQVWAWRRGRIPRIARSATQLQCLLPFEPMLYAGTGLDARFLGHPAAHAHPAPEGDGRTVLLAPGSRPAEVQRLWPAFLATARLLPECRFRVLLAPGVGPLPTGGMPIEATTDLDGPADVALAASGTITLQLAARRIPMVVAYQVHPLTWAVGKRVVKVPWVALPNLVLGRQVVPEVLQDVRPAVLARCLRDVLAQREAQRAALDEVVARLRGRGALERMGAAARLVFARA